MFASHFFCCPDALKKRKGRQMDSFYAVLLHLERIFQEQQMRGLYTSLTLTLLQLHLSFIDQKSAYLSTKKHSEK